MFLGIEDAKFPTLNTTVLTGLRTPFGNPNVCVLDTKHSSHTLSETKYFCLSIPVGLGSLLHHPELTILLSLTEYFPSYM